MERRSGLQIMKRLILELKPLIAIMFITITMGVLGFLAAISIGTFGAVAIGAFIGEITFISVKGAVILMIVSALLRGFLRYGEQLSGHYIAFKILYILRDKIFHKLRKLAPAKLEGQEKGKLISIITSDIELLEVFYAHTIAPIAIAIITNTIISIILYMISPYFGVLSAIFFLIVGLVIPYFSSSLGKDAGMEYRNMFGECNNYVLDSLRGIKEVLQFKNGEERLEEINNKSRKINKSLEKLKEHEGLIRAITDLTIMIAILTFVGVGFYEYSLGNITFTAMILGIVIIASSFGPVVALSNLSNTLLQTFASAERLFNLLDEEPLVLEVEEGKTIKAHSINYNKVDFSYPNREEKIFSDATVNIQKGDKIALAGESGIGKSTFVKLLMRFWDVNKGEIKIGKEDIKGIETTSLRNSQVLVSQETYLFNESILDNIKIGNLNATREEVEMAAKKASVDKFIKSLPKGYDTKVGELGSNLSSGERQRIGLARAFLSNGEILILDEPTSNLDTLNEGEILKSIKENCDDKTIVLITHRKSTTTICDKTYKLQQGKLVLS
ncbi:ABC transporter ATP-binding protein [Clostridium massiliamazoniense]|uniref:ABC transporter ATP-binding protein n=1 Tax=Clostridium massiliamazoniense TaxID=1347366 RepID=UPI0006D85701|nr:ABC transporter ATP-binding protein [Clostridium massiliamazoniense]